MHVLRASTLEVRNGVAAGEASSRGAPAGVDVDVEGLER
jgi:hypothetical protein